MKVAILLGCVGYAAYGFITGNLMGGGLFTLLALLVLWGIVRPPPRWQDTEQISSSHRLMMLGMVVGSWALAIFCTLGAISQPDLFLGFLAGPAYACALVLTWAFAGAEIKLRRERLLRRSLSTPPDA